MWNHNPQLLMQQRLRRNSSFKRCCYFCVVIIALFLLFNLIPSQSNELIDKNIDIAIIKNDNSDSNKGKLGSVSFPTLSSSLLDFPILGLQTQYLDGKWRGYYVNDSVKSDQFIELPLESKGNYSTISLIGNVPGDIITDLYKNGEIGI